MTTPFPVDCQPLHTVVGSHTIAGVNPSPRTVFVLEKAQRDRLVLLDTQLAPFIRRYSLSDDIQRYGMISSNKFLLCLPAGWTIQHCNTTATGNDAWQCIAERYPALARHLAIPVAERPFTPHHWWELPSDAIIPHTQQPMCTWQAVRTQVHFTVVTPGHVNANPWLPSDAPWLIGILNSTPMQRWMQRTSARTAQVATNMIDDLPIPTALIDHSELHRLASATMAIVAQRIQLNQQGLATLIRNFAPLGVPASSALRSWYDMDLAGLRVALRKSFKNDIPERLHDEWRTWLTNQRDQHDALGQQISSNDLLINRIVAEYLPVPKA